MIESEIFCKNNNFINVNDGYWKIFLPSTEIFTYSTLFVLVVRTSICDSGTLYHLSYFTLLYEEFFILNTEINSLIL